MTFAHLNRHLLALLACGLAALAGRPHLLAQAPAAYAATAPLSVRQVEDFYKLRYGEEVQPVFAAAGSDAAVALDLIEKKFKDELNFSLAREGFKFADHALWLADHDRKKAPQYRKFALLVANDVLRKRVLSEGTFMEYDRNTWLTKDQMWRTIPWGTAFHGNKMVEVYRKLKGHLSPEQDRYWRATMTKTGEWIYKNPWTYTYVFNASIDLIGLLWRLGNELNNEEWKSWALQAGNKLVRDKVTANGWIVGENGGASGHYHMLGADFLAQFAYDSRDPELRATVGRFFRLQQQFVTPSLVWLGNFGTRTSHAGNVLPKVTFTEAAFGNPQAAYLVRQFGSPGWSDNLAQWAQALTVAPAAPTYEKLGRFPDIEGVVVREGPFQASFFNYDKSIWARGFANLWHAEGGVLFSTQHSLPSEVEKAKLRLGDTNDWAGFPHVRVRGKVATYDSHQKLEAITATEANGVTVNWRENLSSAKGQQGGTLQSSYAFQGKQLTMTIQLAGLQGDSTSLDFHLLVPPDKLYGLWAGEEIQAIGRGELPSGGGHFRDRSFAADQVKHYGIQVGKAVYAFTLQDAPAGTRVLLGLAAEKGLHTGNSGGVRLRLALPAGTRQGAVKLQFEKI
ncbi:hypothetical protein [Hymenobacter sp.]|uniref:hypothetical protein n=1 Tax=Hymenobacter sp. TaxID=1898978 RepID=UPI00286C1C8C|nr:hypothetical protein [Hymenobacter sp.]